MTLKWEDCEVFEIDADKPVAGTMVKFRSGYSPTVSQPYPQVLQVFRQAGWKVVNEEHQGGYPDTGRVAHLRRQSLSGRPVDDAIDMLRAV
jgi:hypothetical protein